MTDTRLDRLVKLLDTGHTALIRNTAAQQLADIQKSHPDELYNLLNLVVPCLSKKSWDSRAAAAKALGGIVDNTVKYDPNEEDAEEPKVSTLDNLKDEVEEETNGKNGLASNGHGPSPNHLAFSELDIPLILQHGLLLVRDGGPDCEQKFNGMDAFERLRAEKNSLKSRLGLNGKYVEPVVEAPKSSILVPTPMLDTSVATLKRNDSIASAGVPLSAEPRTPGGGVSARQRNVLKRKLKMEAKHNASKIRVVDFNDRKGSIADIPETPTAPTPFPIKTGARSEEEENGASDYFSLEKGEDEGALVKEFKGEAIREKSAFVTEAEEDGSEWPFTRVCEFLVTDLFDHKWEVRHGAAMGLREILRVHGSGAGRMLGKSRRENDLLNKRWLDDLACRVCCIFMLDRYIDFASDTAVAPIRESAAQTLAAALIHMPESSVTETFEILRRLVMDDDLLSLLDQIWQPRHGALSGMRYLVSTRDDLLQKSPKIMDGVLECTMRGLENVDDDIRSVSAATLIPIAKDIVSNRLSTLDNLILIVWNSLTDLTDDLTASTGNIMDFLAKLCSFPEVLEAMQRNALQDEELSFANLVPRLFPFLRHTITTVRSSVLRALLTFLEIPGQESKGWISSLSLRLIFQNIVLERNDQVLNLSLQVWRALVQTLQDGGQFAEQLASISDILVKLTMHPIGVSRNPIPMDVTLFVKPTGEAYTANAPTQRRISPANGSEPAKKRRKSAKSEKEEQNSWGARSHNIDGSAMEGDTDLIGTDVIVRNKLASAQALGLAISLWPVESRLQEFGQKVTPFLRSSYASSQQHACFVIEEFAKCLTEQDELAATFTKALRPIVEGEPPIFYTDLTSYLHIVRGQCQALITVFSTVFENNLAPPKLPSMAAVVQGDPNASRYAFGVVDAEKIVFQDYDVLFNKMTIHQKKAHEASLGDTRATAIDAIEEAKMSKDKRDIRVKAAAAAAVVILRDMPKKPALTIKAMMDSVKTEENFDMQKRSAAAVAALVGFMVSSGKTKVSDKVVGNLVKFYCTETAETPEFHANVGMSNGILSLKKEEDVRDHPDAAKFEREARAARIMRRGSKEALEQLVVTFGKDLFDRIPVLRGLIERPLKEAFDTDELPADIDSPENNFGQEVVDSLSTLRALVPKFHKDLYPFVSEMLPIIAKALRSKLAVFRYIAAKCFSTICSVMTVEGITLLVDKVLPSINSPLDVHCRQGGIESIYHLIHVMEDGILPYVIFLIVPVLGRMSDNDNDVRLIAATTFATLVKLVPLEAGIPDPPGFSEELLKGRERERNFIAQMLDPKKAEDFKIPVKIEATLRPYQQDGVNWLAFLNRYSLHGILCDDMGLGKTLQTLCVVASDHYLRNEEFEKSQNPDSRKLPTLIVCPPTLSGHWQQEIARFAPFLKAVTYTGPPAERNKVRHLLDQVDVVITSYEVCRNDVAILNPIIWNYCILDEGHLIKNPKAKTTIAVKSFKSYHRLILSGTPIQNNVLELWSLFDFLMPGFLGSEKVFQDRFAKPIAASRNAKSSSKEQEAGALAIEALHKQVLPFLLRRLKEEVLDDLPPKIIQNYYCDLSDLQRRLFEDFGRVEKDRIHEAASEKSSEGQRHIFQALQYMRKLCNSPSLVVKETHKQYDKINKMLAAKNSSLTDIAHAPKLTALKDLLVDCGIGVADTEPQNAFSVAESGAVSQHRALIFCQMKEMLDMVQTQVFQKILPSVQYLRLDGSVEASKRQDIVNRFNTDPSYDCLLLTTNVGGLGLNLTGADTVIFVEHDWNPQKDMQAMDRAHRIGQKKVVNVYRIVTRGTLEEKILNLQRFKIDVASTVVNQQNSALGSMETDTLLDLFNISSTAEGVPAMPEPAGANGNAGISEEDAVDQTGEMRTKGQRHFLDDVAALWDEKQYEEEYNLDNFLANMKG
ncbi:putative TBP associated factor [Microthyrium microscopicum]|uniref:TATA-binding protein-associated factor mot1 n=1 Tax=Microthyrium microscopicum TaxID=703497 RepID=A0A6A6U9J2_9PEZI|nr:putative TBP associated factor [Microthyrium microscopicum]